MDETENREGMHSGAPPVIFQRAKSLRNRMTKPEKVLWEYLRQKPLGFKFRRQHPFHIYILDFYCHQAKLFIEIDGDSHSREFQKEQDAIRTKFIEEQGIEEIRFKNEQVLNQLKNVIEEIERALSGGCLKGIKGRVEGGLKR